VASELQTVTDGNQPQLRPSTSHRTLIYESSAPFLISFSLFKDNLGSRKRRNKREREREKERCFEDIIKDIVQRTTFCIFELLLSLKSTQNMEI